MKWFRRMNRKGKKRSRPHLTAPGLRALELPEDVVLGQARVVLCGRKNALVENTAGILLFTPETIRLQLRDGEIAVIGENLSLRDARKDALYIIGDIRQILLDGGAAP